MASAWIENGPISLPPRSLAYGAGLALALLAVVGVGLGLRAAWRGADAPDLGGAAQTADADTLTAKPIVELPPPVTAPDAATADALPQQTAAAQAVQAKAAKPSGNIDDILTSASEKPPAPARPPADEAPPGAPVKSDVPF